jgi:hypothetical protein
MTRRERLERKVEKREEWAAGRRDKAAAGFERARKIADGIPLGQPILVGHHSEKRHRRDLARIDAGMAAGVESQKMAEHHESKAAGLADQLERSIYSDDANAIAELEARILEREAEATRIKALNVAIRREMKAGLTEGWLARTGATDAEQRAMLDNARLGWAHTPIFPSYVLTNLRGRITADRERIVMIKRRQVRTAAAEAAPLGILIEGTGEYVRVTFAEKPAREILTALKAAGFMWGGGSWSGLRAKLPASVACRCLTGPEWSGSPNPDKPADEWICDDCGRVISAVDKPLPS